MQAIDDIINRVILFVIAPASFVALAMLALEVLA